MRIRELLFENSFQKTLDQWGDKAFIKLRQESLGNSFAANALKSLSSPEELIHWK